MLNNCDASIVYLCFIWILRSASCLRNVKFPSKVFGFIPELINFPHHNLFNKYHPIK